MIRGFDMDGVLAAFNESFLALIRSTTGKDLGHCTSTYPDKWDYYKAEKGRPGVTHGEALQLWKICTTTDFFYKLLPMPGAIEALGLIEAMRFNGDRVYFITVRNGLMTKLYTEWWLRNHGISLPCVIMAQHTKGPLAAALGLEFFVDDKPQHCEEVKLAVPECKVYIVDQPYNREFDAEKVGVERVPGVLNAIWANNWKPGEVVLSGK